MFCLILHSLSKEFLKHGLFFFMILNIRHPGPVLPVTQAKQTDKTLNSLVTVALHRSVI